MRDKRARICKKYFFYEIPQRNVIYGESCVLLATASKNVESTFHGNYISRNQVHREILPISKLSLDSWKFGKLCIRLLRITWLSVPIFITGGAYIYQFIYFNCVTRRCYRVGINHSWGVIKYTGIGAAPL